MSKQITDLAENIAKDYNLQYEVIGASGFIIILLIGIILKLWRGKKEDQIKHLHQRLEDQGKTMIALQKQMSDISRDTSEHDKNYIKLQERMHQADSNIASIKDAQSSYDACQIGNSADLISVANKLADLSNLIKESLGVK